MSSTRKPSLLLVANWDSNVGYAWWLMESFWSVLAENFSARFCVLLAYPSISVIPEIISTAPIVVAEQPIGKPGLANLLKDCGFLMHHSVKAIYFSDRPAISLRYLIYRLCGVRFIIVHDHTPGVRTAPTGLKRALKHVLQRLPWITADGFIGASDYVRQRFIEVNCIPAGKCHSAPNGLPKTSSCLNKDLLRDELGVSATTPVAVMTGRASHYKNIGFILKCLSKLKRQGHNLHFVFCGDGPDLEELKSMAIGLEIGDRVTFTGRRNDIPQLLRQCDFAIHPSLGEVGYSLSILEYMQAGLPVLVPNNPSVCAATTHETTGLIYKNGSEEALIAAIVRLLDDPQNRLWMGQQAAQVVEQQFNLKNTHAALLFAFNKIVTPTEPAKDATT
jgi:glycosyltransferase involved in cell wall biosynthesis